MTLPGIELAAAVAANGVIGRAGQLPWHLPDDLKHFKNLTMGHPVIMGRKTFESVGRALPGRRSIVVSGTLAASPAAGIELARSLDEALELTSDTSGPVFIVGGAALYAESLPRASVLHLTELDEPVDGDTCFPAFDRSAWRLASEIRHASDARHAMSFRFCTYERIASSGR
jgi:dihydrofolate reductase